MKTRCAVFLFILAAFGLARADSVTNIPFNRVIRTTPVNTNLLGAAVGDGLTISNGVLVALGGGGGGAAVDMEAVTNAARAVVAVATNALLPKTDGVTDLSIDDGTFKVGIDAGFWVKIDPFGLSANPQYSRANRYDFPLQNGTIALQESVAADFVAKTKKELHADSATNICWQTCYSNGWVYLLPYSNNTGDAE